MPGSDVREYAAEARATDTFGRMLVSARDQHLVVDGPVQNGCAGEAITPGELFLAAVASCGVELIQVIARERGLALDGVVARIAGTIDRSQPVRADLSLFNSVHLQLDLAGVGDEEAAALVAAFTSR